MQVTITDSLQHSKAGELANSILRKCVHCGFCNATCPTYQLTGDELDGPRGRIYLIKQLLEGSQSGEKTRYHLDRCLQCRACETTCPSGVQYADLLHIGQDIVDKKVSRSLVNSLIRKTLSTLLPRPDFFKLVLVLGRISSPLLPSFLSKKIPEKQKLQPEVYAEKHERNIIILDGCIQQSATPATNSATRRVLDRLGIGVIETKNVRCCGAIPAHLGEPEKTVMMIKNNIDTWWPLINEHTEAILSTASGCGLMISEYEQYLDDDVDYLSKAKKIKLLNKDLSEIVTKEENELKNLFKSNQNERKQVSYHAPCTQQHGLGIINSVEKILTSAGYELSQIKDSHLCCGSAGTYSITQPDLSKKLLKNKIQNLVNTESQTQPEIIATANIGCQLHLQTAASIPVVHWIELIDSVLADQS